MNKVSVDVIRERIKSGSETHVMVLELLRAYDVLHAHLHHFYKYHAAHYDWLQAGKPGTDQEWWYLGTDCADCEFSRSQMRAVDEFRNQNEQRVDV